MNKTEIKNKLIYIQRLLNMTSEEYKSFIKAETGDEVNTNDVFAHRTGWISAEIGWMLKETRSIKK